MDDEIACAIVEVWKDERLIDLDQAADEEDFDDWEDDLEPDAGGGGPNLMTTDGMPLVFCTSEYEFKRRDHPEVVGRLDGMTELHSVA
jgi:hypothetical protein